MKNNFCLGLLFLVFSSLGAFCQDSVDERGYSYLYPVACNNQGVLVLWQKDAFSTELYFWDYNSGRAFKQLCSLFNPAGISMLPGGNAYSFIDNGRVRIKELIKRSPSAIAFEKPIYNISCIHWLDDSHAYCHAQEHGNFGIYCFNRSGDVQCIIKDTRADFLFPSVVDERVFYIYRYMKDNKLIHAIGSVPMYDYKNFGDQKYSIHDQECIISSGPISLAFLTMKSCNKGFVVGHKLVVDDKQKMVPFYYYTIENNDGAWKVDLLFVFSIPTILVNLSSRHRLYESILPLLPLHDADCIYYSSSSSIESSSMRIYCYDQKSAKSRICSIRSGNRASLLFSPIKAKEMLISGGSLVPEARDFVPEVINWGNDLTFKFAIL